MQKHKNKNVAKKYFTPLLAPSIFGGDGYEVFQTRYKSFKFTKKYSLVFFHFFRVSKWRWKVEIAGGLEQKKENPNQ